MAGTNRLYNDFVKRLGTTPSASEDDVIDAILSSAEDEVLDLIGRDELPARLDSAVVELSVIAYNKRGEEGETSRSEGGIGRAFDDLPPYIRARIENYPRKVGVINAHSSN